MVIRYDLPAPSSKSQKKLWSSDDRKCHLTLRDVQPVLFEHIDNMLEELEQNQSSKLLASQTNTVSFELQALNIGNKNNRKYFNSRVKDKSSFRGKTFIHSPEVSSNLLNNIVEFVTLLESMQKCIWRVC